MSEKGNQVFERIIANPVLQEMKQRTTRGDNLGVSQEYDRSSYDNIYKRRKFKEEYFGDNKTSVDYITGETLHLSTKAAKNKYGDLQYSKHIADVDHIIPEKIAYEKLKGNPFLSDRDVKEIINTESNYRVTAGRFNRQKKDSTNIQIVLDREKGYSGDTKAKLVKDHIVADTTINISMAKKTIENVSGEFVSGSLISLEASAIPLMVEGVNNLYLVVNGEKDFEEAVIDMSKLTLSVATIGGMKEVVMTGVTNALKDSSKEVIYKIANSNAVIQIVTISLIVKDSVMKYANGEISGAEFFEEIGEKGVSMLSGAIGVIAGEILIPVPIVGAIIGSMIISTVCTEIYRAYRSVNEFKKTEGKISKLASDALAEMNRQQEMLKKVIQEEFEGWDEQFNKGYEMIYKGTLDNSADTITQGLSCILSVFSKNVAFENQQTFDDMFFDNNSVFTM